MITSVRLVNFKNFADETLRVGPFTVIVGANASGKSNIRDAFRFLHGIGRGYTLAEIIGGKFGPGGQREWEPIRGAPNEIARLEPSDFSHRQSSDHSQFYFYYPSEFTLRVELEVEGVRVLYSIKVGVNPGSPDGFQVMEEELKTDKELIYSAEGTPEDGLCLYTEDTSGPQAQLSRSQPGLTQVQESEGLNEEVFQVLEEVRGLLSDMRFLELSPDRMREPSFPGSTTLGDSGENLPTVVEEICRSSDRGRTLVSWLKELTFMEVEDFEFPPDPSGRVHLMIREANGIIVSAYGVSDGTLRFLAILAALLGNRPQRLLFFEEIDNGIHPVRLSLLMDLIERQTAKLHTQVLTTTHAPTLLTVMNDNTLEQTSVVCRLKDASKAIIRPVAELPDVKELRRVQGLGRLHESGWMEDALFFTEDYDATENGS